MQEIADNKTLPHSMITDFDVSLFQSGKHYRLYEKLGSHPTVFEGKEGVYFGVYAPAAERVEVIGDFNHWNGENHSLNVRWDSSGIWEGFIPNVSKGVRYKYKIYGSSGVFEKADPYARFAEKPPQTASIVWDEKYNWTDKKWMAQRSNQNSLESPYSVYEMHAGSWMYDTEENRPLSWKELAKVLPAYIKDLGFTHVELMPVMQHPYAPSWGYQVSGYFAPDSRLGDPEGFKSLVNALHEEGIGVILDWVPSHFPEDDFSLGRFDGTCVYEHPDPRRGYHPDWKSLIFNYGRNEVKAFLISNALFWLEEFHVDGLRVDAVASMLYLDYSREDGEWEPNQYGGNENLEAIQFIKEFNMAVYEHYPDVQTIAEESTAFSGVTRPVHEGGLGFGMKWMMGWMHDSLTYFAKDPIHRKYHQNEITFSLAYAFTENFMLPISHDEVVYGKKSLLDKMPGDSWQKRANLRTFLGLMYAHPGTKLLFMGSEFGQWGEWDFSRSLDWHLTEYDDHKGIQAAVRSLNKLYRKHACLHEVAFRPEGFEWIDFNDNEQSIISFIRLDKDKKEVILCVANLTPTPHEEYRFGCPKATKLELLINTDDLEFGGSGFKIPKSKKVEDSGWHGRSNSVRLKLPPLSVQYYKLKH
ncbi:MAG: 1,4-alpha-glucan branching protein GlgB [Flavobacteriales bacterium]|nr:1,4-alpha-glucan branching protein GlgB [Flavobacteriales bacterium]